MFRCVAVLLCLVAAGASPPVSLQHKHKKLYQASQNAFLKQKRTQQLHSLGEKRTFHPMVMQDGNGGHELPNFLEAKNMCIKAEDACSAMQSEAMDDANLIKRLNLHAVPDDYDGELLPRALLLTSPVNTVGLKTVHHWGEAIFPVYDHIHRLMENHFALNSTESQQQAAPFHTVLMPQVFSLMTFGDERSSWYLKVVDAIAAESGFPGNVQKMMCQDMVRNELCFESILHLKHAPTYDKSKQVHFFTSPSRADALRDRMFEITGNKGAQKSSRHALIIKRTDNFGWLNHLEVELKLKEALEKRCWKVKSWELPGEYERSVDKQVNLLKHTSLLIGNHVPQNEHMVWMKDNAGVIEDKNCLCSEYGFGKLAHQRGLIYKQTYGPGMPGPMGSCASTALNSCAQSVPRWVNFESEVLPTLHEMLNELEAHNDFGECKTSK